MVTIIKKLAVIAVCFLIIDQAAGLFLDLCRDKSPDGRYYKTKHSLETSDEDVVIIGSSRGEMNYNPFVIEDSLKVTAWNASRGGQGLPYFHAIQNGILNRYVPKIVILNIEGSMLEHRRFLAEAGFLRPFYQGHPETQPILNEISYFEKFYNRLRLFSYNSSYYYLLRPYLIKGLDGRREDKGWKPRDGRIHEIFLRDTTEIVKDTEPLNEGAVAEFEHIAKTFKEKGSRLFIVVSPNYQVYEDNTPTINYLRNFAKSNQIPLLIHSNDTTMIRNPDFFIDPDHLNRQGSTYFTKKLIGEIRPLLTASL